MHGHLDLQAYTFWNSLKVDLWTNAAVHLCTWLTSSTLEIASFFSSIASSAFVWASWVSKRSWDTFFFSISMSVKLTATLKPTPGRNSILLLFQYSNEQFYLACKIPIPKSRRNSCDAHAPSSLYFRRLYKIKYCITGVHAVQLVHASSQVDTGKIEYFL